MTTLAELREKYQRLLEDEVPGTLAPTSAIYEVFLHELGVVVDVHLLNVDTKQAARMLGVTPKTIAHWCEAGRFDGAHRSGEHGGKWTIPVRSIELYLENKRKPRRTA